MRYAVIGLLPAPLRNEAVRRGVGALPLRIRAELWARETAVDAGGRLLGLVVLLGPLQVSLIACVNALQGSICLHRCWGSLAGWSCSSPRGTACVYARAGEWAERVVAEKRGGRRLRLRREGLHCRVLQALRRLEAACYSAASCCFSSPCA